jgi:hypothetical protein
MEKLEDRVFKLEMSLQRLLVNGGDANETSPNRATRSVRRNDLESTRVDVGMSHPLKHAET